MPATDSLWYKDAIFYEVYVRGFFDSNGDGNGDLRGLIEKLDYLRDLGVDCLWLMPIFASPLKDDGYDICRFSRDSSRPGHRRGFRGPDRGGPRARHPHHRRPGPEPHLRPASLVSGSPARSRPRRAATTTSGATPTEIPGTRIIFKDTEHSNWTWDPVARQYYWHRFYSHQPDLNFDNPAVRREILERHGLSGWTAASTASASMPSPTSSSARAPPAKTCRKRTSSARRCAASSTSTIPARCCWPRPTSGRSDLLPYFGERRRISHGVQFPAHAAHVHGHAPRASPGRSSKSWTRCRPFRRTCQWALFLRNHDELTLEMVTDEERDYMYNEYAKDPRMRLNLGIRRRLAPLIDNDRRQIELLYSLLFTLARQPGALLRRRDRHGRQHLSGRPQRRPHADAMVRRPQRRLLAGRSVAALPAVLLDPIYHYQAINVEAQLRSPTSLLQWLRRLIRVRKKYPVFGRGTLKFVPCENRRVVAYLRRVPGPDGAGRQQPVGHSPSRRNWTCGISAARFPWNCSATMPFRRSRTALFPFAQPALLLLVSPGRPSRIAGAS